MALSVPPVSPELIAKMAETASKAGSVPVKTGWGPSAYLLLAILTVLVPLLVAFLRYLPIMRKIKDQADSSLRIDLMKEIEKLRSEQRDERRECDRRLDGYQKKMDAITRKFFQFQLSLVGYLPASAASIAQQSADHILAIIDKPLEDFMEPRVDEDGATVDEASHGGRD